jgi:hypothetical protein
MLTVLVSGQQMGADQVGTPTEVREAVMILKRSSVALVGVVAALGLIGSGLSPAHAVTPGPVRVGPASDCQDVVVLGAKGSGQTPHQNEGFGPEAWLGLTAYAGHMGGYRIGYFPVPYPAAPVETLLKEKTRGEFFASIDTGVQETLKFLAKRQEKCTDERYVLIGYSQGAMAMHRVLWQLARATTKYHQLGRQILPRLDGILAIADGDKAANQGGVSYDTAPDEGAGVWWDLADNALVKDLLKIKVKTKYPLFNAPIPNLSYWPAARFHSVCHASDIVCDWGNPNLELAKEIHESYYGPTGDSAVFVQSAATNIAKTSKENIPRPATSIPALPVRVGQQGRVVLVEDGFDVASIQWLSDPIPNAVLSPGQPTIPATLTWSPETAQVVKYSVRVTFTDGSQKDFSGSLQSFAVPPQSLSAINLQSAYVDGMEQFGTYGSKVTFDVIKTTPSGTTPLKRLYVRSAMDSFEYVSGDDNSNDVLDMGESWSYASFVPWYDWEPGSERSRTVVMLANDTTGAGAFVETELGIALTR